MSNTKLWHSLTPPPSVRGMSFNDFVPVAAPFAGFVLPEVKDSLQKWNVDQVIASV